MNLITNGDFSTGYFPEWQLSLGSTTIIGGQLQLTGSPFDVGLNKTGPPVKAPDAVYTSFVYVRFVSGPPCAVALLVKSDGTNDDLKQIAVYSDGQVDEFAQGVGQPVIKTTFVNVAQGALIEIKWRPTVVPSPLPEITVGYFNPAFLTVAVRAGFSGTGKWAVDDFAVVEGDILAVSKWDAYSRLKLAMSAINGTTNGYYLDLGGRVYSKLIYPQEGAKIKMPYCCLPLIDERPNIRHVERMAQVRWKAHARFFIRNESSTLTDDKSVELAAKLHDDVWRSIMLDPTLAKSVKDAQITDFETFAGDSDDDAPYAEMSVEFELYQLFSSDDLGPSAT